MNSPKLSLLLFSTLALVLFAGKSAGQEARPDLPVYLTEQFLADTMHIRANTVYRVLASYALPCGSYSLDEVVTAVEESPLGFPKPRDGTGEACPLMEPYLGIEAAPTEKEVKDSVTDLERLLKTVDYLLQSKQCVAAQVNSARLQLSATKREWLIGPYSRGTVIRLTVRRPGTETDGHRFWERLLATPPRGAWITTFGFSFIPLVISKSESYFSRDSADVYVVTEESQVGELDFVPSVLFTYADAGQAGREWVWDRLMGGLGVTTINLPQPTVFLSTGISYRRNLSFYTGFALAPVAKLRGRYNEDDIITENLDSSQLLTTSYGINPIFGIAFRFGSNPFKPAKESPSGARTPPSTKEDAPGKDKGAVP